jgi:hypothetical protein
VSPYHSPLAHSKHQGRNRERIPSIPSFELQANPKASISGKEGSEAALMIFSISLFCAKNSKGTFAKYFQNCRHFLTYYSNRYIAHAAAAAQSGVLKLARVLSVRG